MDHVICDLIKIALDLFHMLIESQTVKSDYLCVRCEILDNSCNGPLSFGV